MKYQIYIYTINHISYIIYTYDVYTIDEDQYKYLLRVTPQDFPCFVLNWSEYLFLPNYCTAYCTKCTERSLEVNIYGFKSMRYIYTYIYLHNLARRCLSMYETLALKVGNWEGKVGNWEGEVGNWEG